MTNSVSDAITVTTTAFVVQYNKPITQHCAHRKPTPS